MTDSTVKKVDSTSSPTGEMGQKDLVTGKEIGLWMWDRESINHNQRSCVMIVSV